MTEFLETSGGWLVKRTSGALESGEMFKIIFVLYCKEKCFMKVNLISHVLQRITNTHKDLQICKQSNASADKNDKRVLGSSLL